MKNVVYCCLFVIVLLGGGENWVQAQSAGSVSATSGPKRDFNRQPKQERTTQEKLVDAYVQAKGEINNAAAKVVKTIQGMRDADLKKEIDTLIVAVRNKPEDFSLHVKFCDALIARIDQLINTNQAAMSMDLVSKRDRIVKILNELSIELGEKSEVTSRKAQQSTGSTKEVYLSLHKSEQRIIRVYKARSDEFSSIDIDASTKDLAANIECLTHVRDFLSTIKPALSDILADVETLQNFQQMGAKLDEIQSAIDSFAESLRDGILDIKSKKKKGNDIT